MVDKNLLSRLQLIMLENMPKMLLAKNFSLMLKLLPVMLSVTTAVNYVYIPIISFTNQYTWWYIHFIIIFRTHIVLFTRFTNVISVVIYYHCQKNMTAYTIYNSCCCDKRYHLETVFWNDNSFQDTTPKCQYSSRHTWQSKAWIW